MPPPKKLKALSVPDPSIRTIDAQLRTLDSSRLKAIFAAVKDVPAPGTSGRNVIPSESSSPSKRKKSASPELPSAPSTPSPKKRRPGDETPVESPLLSAYISNPLLSELMVIICCSRALASLSSTDAAVSPRSRTSRVRTLTPKAKAAQDEALKLITKTRKVQRVYPDVKVEPLDAPGLVNGDDDVFGTTDVIDVSSDDDLPPVSRCVLSC
ncbi:hypothetical protein C0992_011798 [Termitomyces sp. T32_za158]|nr:hypothetical protein C0992_011798 [Termitomyces sp. T32_za158]